MPLDIHARYSGRTAYFAAPTDALFTDNASRYSSWGEQLMAVASASVVVPIAAVSIVLLGIIYLCVHFAYHAILIIYALDWGQNDRVRSNEFVK